MARPRQVKNGRTIAIFVPDDMAQSVEALAAREGISKSAAARALMTIGIKATENEEPVIQSESTPSGEEPP